MTRPFLDTLVAFVAIVLLSMPNGIVAEPCTLCYDRTTPLHADRVINSGTGLTCSGLDDIARAEITIDSSSPQCTNFFHPWGFLACGCVEPPAPTNPACTFCPDGSDPPEAYQDVVIIPHWSVTCAQFNAFVRFTEDAVTCSNVQKDSDLLCGCPTVPTISPAPTVTEFDGQEQPSQAPSSSACELCNDGTYPQNLDVVINTPFGSYTCKDLADNGPAGGLVPYFQCESLQNFSYSHCGCGQSQTPPETASPAATPAPSEAISCPICANVVAPSKPNTIITINGTVDYTCAEMANGAADDLIAAPFCKQVQDYTAVECGCDGSTASPTPATVPPTPAPVELLFPSAAPSDLGAVSLVKQDLELALVQELETSVVELEEEQQTSTGGGGNSGGLDVQPPNTVTDDSSANAIMHHGRYTLSATVAAILYFL